MELEPVELSDYMQAFVKKAKRRQKLNCITSTAISAVLGYLAGDGLWCSYKEEPYAPIRTVITVACLGVYCTHIFEPKHKKTERKLNEMFDKNKTYIGKGSWWYTDSQSPIVYQNGAKCSQARQYKFSMVDFNPLIKDLSYKFFDDVTQTATALTYIDAVSFKTAFAKAIHTQIEKEVEPFVYGASLRDFDNDGDLCAVFKLKLAHELYHHLNNCVCDEDLVEFLEEGITDSVSLFSGAKPSDERMPYFKRESYSLDKKRAISMRLQGTATFGFGAVLCGVYDSFFSLGSLFFASSAIMMFNSLCKAGGRHLHQQRNRFLKMSKKMKIVFPVELLDLERDDVVAWREKEVYLTPHALLQNLTQAFDEVESFLKQFPDETECAFAGKMFMTNVLKSKEKKAVLNAVAEGETIESASKKFGLSFVNKVLTLDMFTCMLKSYGNKPIRKFFFDMADNHDFQKAILRTQKRTDQVLLKKEATIEALFERGKISQAEKEYQLKNIMTETHQYRTVVVPAETKLPAMILRLKKEKMPMRTN